MQPTKFTREEKHFFKYASMLVKIESNRDKKIQR